MLCHPESQGCCSPTTRKNIARVTYYAHVCTLYTIVYLIYDPFNDWGVGRGCNEFVPVLGGNGTIIAPIGDIFDLPPGGMN